MSWQFRYYSIVSLYSRKEILNRGPFFNNPLLPVLYRLKLKMLSLLILGFRLKMKLLAHSYIADEKNFVFTSASFLYLCKLRMVKIVMGDTVKGLTWFDTGLPSISLVSFPRLWSRPLSYCSGYDEWNSERTASSSLPLLLSKNPYLLPIEERKDIFKFPPNSRTWSLLLRPLEQTIIKKALYIRDYLRSCLKVFFTSPPPIFRL